MRDRTTWPPCSPISRHRPLERRGSSADRGSSARVGHDDFQFIALGGQFLDRDGDTRKTAAAAFLENLERQTTREGLQTCFPCPVLRLESPIGDFYEFLGIR
ncbi:MAG: hypothetical protein HY294_00825 [Candidatus Rokubacteria bacterium]|nr:hypothetical protein [Candidatus Rokubacteria bacterium]MBI3824523.1 hypothetical protein [Candidatus Rokubacteria bacterium]